MMQMLNERRRSPLGAAKILLCAMLMCGVVAGCGSKNFSEADLLARLQAAGVTVERLQETLITSKQIQRIESEHVGMFSARVSNAAGHNQVMTLIQFDKDWKAAAVGEEGVVGFAVRNWYFVGGTDRELRTQIEGALL